MKTIHLDAQSHERLGVVVARHVRPLLARSGSSPDDHLADAAGTEQVWTSRGWVERFGLPFDPRDTGYGHRSQEVADVQVGSGELLAGYHDAVHQQTEA